MDSVDCRLRSSALDSYSIAREAYSEQEKDPAGRYVRYSEVLGEGAFKTVYKAFDEVDGLEVAWCQEKIERLVQSPEQLERLYSELHLLKSLKHENIIPCYSSWVDDKNKTINLITELFTCGSLRRYREKHKNVGLKAIKNWAKQILQGLHYLHTHNPPIIHRDIKCDNIFLNGNNGKVKIGDLGLATVMRQTPARSVVGTPEFMAPELYDEEYNELADIYSFGMCILELVTCECPYSECRNPVQIYKKVSSGVKPASLKKVSDPQVKQFIEKCLVPAPLRLSAQELLKDPFFGADDTEDPVYNQMQLLKSVRKAFDLPESESHAMDIDPDAEKLLVRSSDSGVPMPCDMMNLPEPELQPMDMEVLDCMKKLSLSTHMKSSSGSPPQVVLKVQFEELERGNHFTLRGKKLDDTSISMVLLIVDSCGHSKKIEFEFYLDSDTTLSIAQEMVEHLQLSSEDVAVIAELMDCVMAYGLLLLPTSVHPSPDLAKAAASDTVGEQQHLLSLAGDGEDQGTMCSAVSGMLPAKDDAGLASYVNYLKSLGGCPYEASDRGCFSRGSGVLIGH